MSKKAGATKTSKPFAVATEGETIDGRKIERKWLEDIAATYDPTKYGARIWLEHIRGLMPDSPFRAYGDVVSLSVEDVDGKRTLFATIDALPELVAMNQAGQKVYTSIEVEPNFANTGRAYLMGLAVTDTPASLGTSRLEFSSRMGSRQLKEGNAYSALLETAMEFDQADDEGGLFNAAMQRLGGLVAKFKAKSDAQFGEVGQVLEAVAEGLGEVLEQQGEVVALRETVTELEGKLGEFKADFDALRERLDQQPNTPPRPPATGGNGAVLTDC